MARTASGYCELKLFPARLDDAQARQREASSEVVDCYSARAPATTDQVTPAQIVIALEQFFDIAQRLDCEYGETAAIVQEDVSQIGDYGLQLLTDLSNWANQLDLQQAASELRLASLGASDWVLRHHGEIRTPEIVVDTLANLANTTSDVEILKQLESVMTNTLHGLSTFHKRDLETTNPGRPWRVLHINRAIVATRTLDPTVMRRVFDEFVQELPAEAPQFFAEGQAQMTKSVYPEAVREIVRDYYDIWHRRRMH